MKRQFTRWLYQSLILSSLSLTGCMMHKPDGTLNQDPFIGYNRAMFAFNMDADHLVIRPVAKIYHTITPPPLQEGVTNVFDNIDEIPTFSNDFLQGNFRYMVVDLWRLAINSTVGVGGLFDVATRMGIARHVETFGLTLAKWRGGQSAPYVVLPLFGPSTIQTAIGQAADYYGNFWPYLRDRNIDYIAHGVKFTNIRARLLPADKLIDGAFDPYIFVRDAYLQKQEQKIKENEALPKTPPSKGL